MAYLASIEPELGPGDCSVEWSHVVLTHDDEDDRRSPVPTWDQIPMLVKSLGLMCWADNLYTFATSIGGACSRMQCVELYLQRHWGFTMKAGSKEVLLGKGHAAYTAPDGWRLVQQLAALGHRIADDGGPALCVHASIEAAWRSYWANFEGIGTSLGLATRVKHLKRVVDPCILFRLP